MNKTLIARAASVKSQTSTVLPPIRFLLVLVGGSLVFAGKAAPSTETKDPLEESLTAPPRAVDPPDGTLTSSEDVGIADRTDEQQQIWWSRWSLVESSEDYSHLDGTMIPWDVELVGDTAAYRNTAATQPVRWVYLDQPRVFSQRDTPLPPLPSDATLKEGWNLLRVATPVPYDDPHIIWLTRWEALTQQYLRVEPGESIIPNEIYFALYAEDPSSVPSRNNFAAEFNGLDEYVEIKDLDAYSQPTTGALSVEVWLRPASLRMPKIESSGYANWFGKGGFGEHEWTFRMYSKGNLENRGNRISFYALNANGGLGVGSYFQDKLLVGQWIHVVATLDDSQTAVYRDGAFRKQDPLYWKARNLVITPTNQEAPIRIGTRDKRSFFQGAIGRVAIYNTKLSPSQIQAHYQAGGTFHYDDLILSEPSLVGYWPLDEIGGQTAFDRTGTNHAEYQGTVTLGVARWEP